MKKKSAIAVLKAAAVALALILPLVGCSFFGLPEYELSVTIEPGVSGTPLSGEQVLADLTEVEYAYTPVNALHTVEVIFDGSRAAASGTITMFKSITLVAQLVDIRDVWDLIIYNADATTLGTAKITFSGANILGGTFSDSRGYTGTWDGTSNKITITYGNWEKFILSGTLFSMSGSWSNGGVIGTWVAVRAE